MRPDVAERATRNMTAYLVFLERYGAYRFVWAASATIVGAWLHERGEHVHSISPATLQQWHSGDVVLLDDRMPAHV